MSLQNKEIVLTGKMSRVRSEIERMIIGAGNVVSNRVSRTTDYLVVGSMPSGGNGQGTTKYRSAIRNNVVIIGEEDLYNIIREASTRQRLRTEEESLVQTSSLSLSSFFE